MSNAPGIQSDIQCPFFRSLGAMSISCESPVSGAKCSVVTFNTIAKRTSHVLWHCNEPDGAGCPMYAAVMAKYKDK